jgi:hypothetical protein
MSTTPAIAALERWQENPHCQKWLAEMLATPNGQLLIAALSEFAKPIEDFNTIDRAGESVIEKMALHHCLAAGQQLALTNLQLLAKPSEPMRELPHDGWEAPVEESE